MATTEFDIPKLFEVVFNYKMAPYPTLIGEKPFIASGRFPPNAFKNNGDQDYDIVIPTRRERSNLDQQYYRRNLLGLEMFMPVTLLNKKGEQAIELQNTIISLKLKKTIVETPLIGRQGTVKELISVDDWSINIKGMIVSPDNEYPEDAVTELRNFVNMNEALGISSVLTAIFLDKDENVVIKDFDLSEMRGIQHAQGFSMSMVSDIAFDLILG